MTPPHPDNPGNERSVVSVSDDSDKLTIRIGDDITIDRSVLQSLARSHHIRSMSLFGSAARGEATPQSDIDLLIEFESGQAPSLGTLVTLQDELSALFGGRRVDVATPSILRNPYRRQAIEQEARTLYAA